jgi:Glycosyl hydrolase 109, C-terminal domain/Oxidoreductase family, NAD-binding Rossmann fold/TAT (twin-arginine translocation) pathway signal sequence
MTDNSSRRDFLKVSAVAGVAMSLGASGEQAHARRGKRLPYGANAKRLETVRIGFVGIGGMGGAHFRNLLRIPGAEIRAICDIKESKIKRALNWVAKAGKPTPEVYDRGETDFERMCERDDLDLVFNATPWQFHVPICLAAMKNGKHAATEVPAALTRKDSWKLVDMAEKTGLYCVMMENCCYCRPELMVLNMVRQGVLGEVMHAECGYMHDLRGVKFSRGGEGLWRRDFATKIKGNFYPTHGLGPVAQCMNINRGDCFDYLVSMSTPSRGLQDYASRLKPDDPRRNEKYIQGDVNSSLIKTKKGYTIVLQHDCNLPRPYSRINIVQGTKGIFQGYPDRVFIEGRSPGHKWEEADKYYPEFEHPLWTKHGPTGKGFGHGSMDYIEDYRLIEALRTETLPDMDVYDAASWSCIVEMSQISLENKSRPVDFPDFTRGKWKTNKPLGIIGA